MNTFIDRFSQLRSAKNASFQCLSDAIGISLRALKYYANGEREPSMSTLIALADFFSVSLDYLVGRSDDPNLH